MIVYVCMTELLHVPLMSITVLASGAGKQADVKEVSSYSTIDL